MHLHKLQEYWQSYILNRHIEDLACAVLGNDSKNGLQIYANAYEARLSAVLEETFPYLKKYMGQKKFDQYCADYSVKNPSQYYSLSKTGKNFSEYLNKHCQKQANKLYAEIAMFEWAISFALDAPDAPCVSLALLQKIPAEKWPHIIFNVHPSLQILTFNYNIIKLYESLLAVKIKNPKNNNQKNYCRVWRKENQVYYLPIIEAEYVFLKSIQEKLTFSRICEKLGKIMPSKKAADYAALTLSQWLSETLITGIANSRSGSGANL